MKHYYVLLFSFIFQYSAYASSDEEFSNNLKTYLSTKNEIVESEKARWISTKFEEFCGDAQTSVKRRVDIATHLRSMQKLEYTFYYEPTNNISWYNHHAGSMDYRLRILDKKRKFAVSQVFSREELGISKALSTLLPDLKGEDESLGQYILSHYNACTSSDDEFVNNLKTYLSTPNKIVELEKARWISTKFEELCGDAQTPVKRRVPIATYLGLMNKLDFVFYYEPTDNISLDSHHANGTEYRLRIVDKKSKYAVSKIFSNKRSISKALSTLLPDLKEDYKTLGQDIIYTNKRVFSV